MDSGEVGHPAAGSGREGTLGLWWTSSEFVFSLFTFTEQRKQENQNRQKGDKEKDDMFMIPELDVFLINNHKLNTKPR